MPSGNRTGPTGLGPMTGRAAGFCAGFPVPGYMNPIPSRGFRGCGRGGGRGWRHWYYATGLPDRAKAGYGYPVGGPVPDTYAPYGVLFAPTMTAEQELDGLKGQAEYFQNALGEINARIDELGKEAKK